MIFTANLTNPHLTISSKTAVTRPPSIAAPQLTLVRGKSLFMKVSAASWISAGMTKRDTLPDSISTPDQYSEKPASTGNSVTIA